MATARLSGQSFVAAPVFTYLNVDFSKCCRLFVLSLLSAIYAGFTFVERSLTTGDQGGHKPGKPGILRDFSEHGKLGEFCATSGKNCNKKVF